MPADNMRLGGSLRIDKWDPADLERKFAIEERMRAEVDAADPNHHALCHTPGERGGGASRPDTCTPATCAELHPALAGKDDEIHVDCGYGEIHERALAELATQGVAPIETIHADNSLVNTGLTDYNNLLIGAGGTVYSNANALMGAGDTGGATGVGDVDMKAATGATHRYINAMDATFPTVLNGVLTFRATFAAANGVFTWLELATTTTAGGAVGTGALTRMLNRFLSSPGAKPNTQSWQVTETMTLA